MTSVVAPALQAGDMAAAGLTGWSPAGLACSLLEAVELSTGLGWAGTLALTTVGVRTALLWPQIRSMRAAARIQPYQAQIEKIQAESVAAARAGNMPRAQELSLERASIYQTAGVKVSDMFIAPLTMLPAQLGLFFGVKRMSDLPLPSLAADTWAWLPSLAAADPMWLLPIMNTVAIQATLYMSLKDAPTEKGAHMINAFRVLSLTGLPVMLNFSSVSTFFHLHRMYDAYAAIQAINILILTQSLFGVVQTGILRQAFVRRAVGLPPILNDIKLPTVRDSFGAFQNYLDDVKKQAEAGKR
jgi:YidC/Oxa1 family membrane protein insertase